MFPKKVLKGPSNLNKNKIVIMNCVIRSFGFYIRPSISRVAIRSLDSHNPFPQISIISLDLHNLFHQISILSLDLHNMFHQISILSLDLHNLFRWVAITSLDLHYAIRKNELFKSCKDIRKEELIWSQCLVCINR